jgi:hypothetical protein
MRKKEKNNSVTRILKNNKTPFNNNADTVSALKIKEAVAIDKTRNWSLLTLS